MQINDDFTLTIFGIKFTAFLLFACLSILGGLIEYIKFKLDLMENRSEEDYEYYKNYAKKEFKIFLTAPVTYAAVFFILHIIYIIVME